MKNTICSLIAMSLMPFLLTGCRNKTEVERRVEQTTDQATLASIAIDCDYMEARAGMAAVAKLTDESLLVKVAVEGDSTDVQLAALEKLEKQESVAAVAELANEWDICRAAAEKLSNQALLARVAKGKHGVASDIAMEKLTDETLLAQIAIEVEDRILSSAAVQRLTDPALLAKVAIEAEEFGTWLGAIQRLADDNLLMKVALEGDEDRCLMALERISDPTLLARIAVSGSGDICLRALEKLTDESLLAQVALGDNGKTNSAALGRLMDQTLVAKIATDHNAPLIRIEAVDRLTDQATLVKVAGTDSAYSVRYAAMERIGALMPLSDSGLESDPTVAALAKTMQAFGAVPEAHRRRLVQAVLPIIEVLGNPDVIGQVGELTAAKTSWASTSQTYNVIPDPDRVDPEFGIDMAMLVPLRNVSGEVFAVSISSERSPRLAEQTWETEFPAVTGAAEFIPADIDAGDLLETLFGQLPSSVVTKFTTEYYPPVIQRAASVKVEEFQQ